MQMRLTTLPVQLQIDSKSMLFRVSIAQATLNGCCDFIAQCTLVRINHLYLPSVLFNLNLKKKIYRCWIVWGKNIRIVIVPSFLAITYIGQSIYFINLISQFQFIASESSYLASVTRCSNNKTRRTFWCSMGEHTGSNRSGRIHGCECPGDRLDRVQNPQGVHGS